MKNSSPASPADRPAAQSSVRQFQGIAHVAFMAALIAAGAYFHMQIGPVPISFQDMFICLAGLALGPRLGVLAILLYLVAGLAGLPVFAGGKSGPAVLLGPTGGYLVGFIGPALCAGIGGRIARRGVPAGVDLPISRLLPALLGCCVGMLPVYGLGALRLAQVLGCGLDKALAVGVWPFLPIIPLKLVSAVLIWRLLRRRGLVPQ